jgi:hypothetical protein
MKKSRCFLIAGFVFILLMVPGSLLADGSSSYVVYSVIGNICKVNGSTKSGLQPRMQVLPSTKVSIPKGCALTIIDREAGKMYSIARVGTNTVEALVKSVSAPKNLSKQYMGYLVKQLFDKDNHKLIHPNAYMQSTATAYRSETKDSFFLESVLNLVNESATKKIEDAFCQQSTILYTGYNVKFDIVSCATDMPIGGTVTEGESCYLRVSNLSEKPLFCNVVNIDTLAHKSLLLPIDRAVTCSNLLVPADGEVDFKSEPFVFSSSKSKETFLLFATEEPVDFSILLSKNVGKTGKWSSMMPLGVYRKIVLTR